jgi:hypothetical protein
MTLIQKPLSTEDNTPDSKTEDSSLIDYNLSLTYEERLLNHQRALDTVNELLAVKAKLKK